MNDLKTIENKIVGRITKLSVAIDAIQQPRSDFAIAHFVVGQNDTPERQYMQAVLELQIKMFNIQRAQLEERKMLIERGRQVEIKNRWTTGKRERALAQIEIERIDTDLAELRLARLGAIRESECLLAILDKLPSFTYTQLQEAEADYWVRRLSRQALQDMKAFGGVSVGNLEAIGQMLRNPGDRTATISMEELASIGETGAGVERLSISEK